MEGYMTRAERDRRHGVLVLGVSAWKHVESTYEWGEAAEGAHLMPGTVIGNYEAWRAENGGVSCIRFMRLLNWVIDSRHGQIEVDGEPVCVIFGIKLKEEE
jgi:hypothetical protein